MSTPNDFPPSKNNKPVFIVDDLGIEDPAILEFLKKSKKFNKMFATRQDLEFVRVIEDLINVLITKGIIQFTDLNEVVIEKLLKKQTLRHHLNSIYDKLF